jgi:hypothetical protein
VQKHLLTTLRTFYLHPDMFGIVVRHSASQRSGAFSAGTQFITNDVFSCQLNLERVPFRLERSAFTIRKSTPTGRSFLRESGGMDSLSVGTAARLDSGHCGRLSRAGEFSLDAIELRRSSPAPYQVGQRLSSIAW